MARQAVTIILPTLNEELNIAKMIKELNSQVKPLEIIVVDDNSSDNTRKFAAKAAKNVIVIHRTAERGVASAILAGIEKAKGEIIVWMDADLSMPAKIIPKMLLAIAQGSDIAIGSRYAKGGEDNRRFSRVFTSRIFNLFAQLVLNFGVKDCDSGFVATKKEVFEKVSFDASGHGEYCIEFLYKAFKKGFRIKEIGYIFTEREFGESKTASHLLSLPYHGFKYCWRVLKIRF